MSSTIANGYKLPADGDKGSTFFDDLESNITKISVHSHNGTDSEKLTATSVAAVSQAIAKGTWGAADSNGIFNQAVAMSSPLEFDEVSISIRIDEAGHADDKQIIHPTIIKTGTSTYTIYVNDDSMSLKAIYS